MNHFFKIPLLTLAIITIFVNAEQSSNTTPQTLPPICSVIPIITVEGKPLSQAESFVVEMLSNFTFLQIPEEVRAQIKNAHVTFTDEKVACTFEVQEQPGPNPSLAGKIKASTDLTAQDQVSLNYRIKCTKKASENLKCTADLNRAFFSEIAEIIKSSPDAQKAQLDLAAAITAAQNTK